MKRKLRFLPLVLVVFGCGNEKNGQQCLPRVGAVCAEGSLYWQDSCGVRGEKIRACDCGCNAAGTDCATPCTCTPQCAGRCCGGNGCGGICPDECASRGQTCDGSTCLCQGSCNAKSCAELGKECGSWDDGCGMLLDCGTCPSGSCSADGRCVCQEGEKRCQGRSFQRCTGGVFVESEACGAEQSCSVELGCVDCLPEAGHVCYQGNVHSCQADGSIGGLVETCWTEECVAGNCGDPACPPETMYVYVVDDAYRLLSFNPSAAGDPFVLIGDLDCPAGDSWPEWSGGSTATPFSMSVDRSGRAWVLYTSGEIFWVDTATASCAASPYPKGQGNFKLFGMGFVSDAAGSDTERLYLSGGNVDAQVMGSMAVVDPNTMGLSVLGPCPPAEYSPELTGTGKGEWYAYFPGVSSSFVARLSKQTGAIEQRWSVPALGATVRAWAFAHWGGKFYIFVTTYSGGYRSRVLRFDPQSGSTDTYLDDLPYIIVGAGVSTCAPFQ